MKLNKEPKTKETVYLELSKHSCNSYLTIEEVVAALKHAKRPDLAECFMEEVKKLGEKTLGDFLELCSGYVDLKIV